MTNFPDKKSAFASDNCAGICPEALKGLIEVNSGFAPSYGEDLSTQKASDSIRELFRTDCDVFFVFNGTAANSLALSSICQSYHSIICHELAHIETDECGGPEFFSNGSKLLTVPGENGKVDLDAVQSRIVRRKDIHYPRPHVLSITQPTETGTVYSVDQLSAASDLAHKYGLHVHVDGARFANAVASLNVHPSEISWKAGVDVLCFGGTKNGMALSEAVVFFNHALASDFEYHCKQAGQLSSKMRFISAPWISMLADGAWLRHAEQANRCASLLAKSLQKYPSIKLMYPCEANAVFVKMEHHLREKLRNLGWVFHDFIGTGYSRFMCSWATKEEDIKNLMGDIESAI